MTEDEQAIAIEEFLATVGRFVIMFQYIEARIETILLLWWGDENWEKSKIQLPEMTNKQKIDRLWDEFQKNPHNTRGRLRPEWVAHVEELVGRLHAAREKRNSLVHAHYIFDFLEIGHPIVGVDKMHGARPLSSADQETMLTEISQLGIDIGFVHLQFVHDFSA